MVMTNHSNEKIMVFQFIYEYDYCCEDYCFRSYYDWDLDWDYDYV